MKKIIFSIALLFGLTTKGNPIVFVVKPKFRNFLSHNFIKKYNKAIKFHSKRNEREVRAVLINMYKKLRNIESYHYEYFSKADIFWLEEKLEFIENKLKTLDFNINCDINNLDSKDKTFYRKKNFNNKPKLSIEDKDWEQISDKDLKADQTAEEIIFDFENLD